MKKLFSFIFMAGIFFAGTFFYFLSKKENKNSVLTESQIRVNPIQAAQTVISKKIETPLEQDEKITKALKYIRQKARKPTAQMRVDPQNLVGQESLLGTRWKIWSTARALKPDAITAADQVVGQINRYNIVETDLANSSLNNFDRLSPTVVYDSRLKRPGLVTGLVIVVTERADLLENSLTSLDAEISDSFKDISTYFVVGRQKVFDLEKLFISLKPEPYIKKIELDILDRDYEKK